MPPGISLSTPPWTTKNQVQLEPRLTWACSTPDSWSIRSDFVSKAPDCSLGLGCWRLRDRGSKTLVLPPDGKIGKLDRQYPAPGSALNFAATALQDCPDCQARTVDISGDGVSGDGIGPEVAYSASLLAGVTVNGLLTTSPEPKISPWANAELVAWFEEPSREILRDSTDRSIR